MASIDKRTPQSVNYAKLPNPGPFLARIVNNADPMKMGSLEVELLRPVGNFKDAGQQLFTVRYLSPFYGVTSIDHNGTNANDFNDTQKSYGFWAVPPDIGVIVMVIFVEADPGQGFWVGCVQDTFMNHMIPGIAASNATQPQSRDQDDTQWKSMAPTEQLFGDSFLPVGEINRAEFKKSDNAPNPNPDVEWNKKPVHPIAKWLYEQGTLHDPVRGVYTSSARRESPSNVYGWSTPGPKDKRQGAKKGKIGRREGKIDTFVSRMGGFCIVMDDGDERFLRKTRPWEGPPEYADIENGEQGLVDWPKDEAFRIRTRKGAQILMHNSEDLIFITNSRGTAWIELTSRGAINFHAQEGVHFGTDGDLSMSAGRDIIQASSRDVIQQAAATITHEAGNRISMTSQTHIHLNSVAGDIGGSAQNIAFQGNSNINLEGTNLNFGGSNHEWSVGGNLMITCTGNMEIRGANTFITADSEMHLIGGSGLLALSRNIDLYSGSEMAVQADGGLSLKSGESMLLNSGSLLSMASSGGPAVLSAVGLNFQSSSYSNLNAKTIGMTGSDGIKMEGKGGKLSLAGEIQAKADGNIHLNGPDPGSPDKAKGPSPAPSIREAVEAHHAAKTAPGYAGIGGPEVGMIQSANFTAPDKPPSAAKVKPDILNAENLNPAMNNMHMNDVKNPLYNYGKAAGSVGIPQNNPGFGGLSTNLGGSGGESASTVLDHESYLQKPVVHGGSGYSAGGGGGGGGGGGLQGGHIGWASMRSGRDAMHDLNPSLEGSPTDQYGTPARVTGAWTKDEAFLGKAAEVGQMLGITRNEMLAIMLLESSCNPQAKNGSHVGLIQMGPSEANAVGTSTGALLGMNRVQQMEYVKKYFQWRMGKSGSPGEVGGAYMLVALPAWANRPLTQPLATGSPGDKYYSFWVHNPAWRDKQIPGNPITRRGVGEAVKKRVRSVDASLGGNSPGSAGTEAQPNTIQPAPSTPAAGAARSSTPLNVGSSSQYQNTLNQYTFGPGGLSRSGTNPK